MASHRLALDLPGAPGEERAMPTDLLLYAALAVLFAATIQGMVGFAFALVSMGLLPQLLGGGPDGLRQAVCVTMVLGNIGNLMQVAQYRRQLSLTNIGPLLAGAAIGLPYGVSLQARGTPGLVQGLGAVLIAFSAYQLVSQLRGGEPTRTPIATGWGYLAGLAGGVLGGALGTSGPPIVIYCALRRWDPDVVRGTQVSYFAISGAAQIALYAHRGLLDGPTLIGSLALLPVVPVGLWLGWRLTQGLDATGFRRLVLVLLALLGARLIASG